MQRRFSAQREQHGPLTKFPRTEHLFDAGGSGVTRDDLVLPTADAAARFYAPGIVVAVQASKHALDICVRWTEDASAEHI